VSRNVPSDNIRFHPQPKVEWLLNRPVALDVIGHGSQKCWVVPRHAKGAVAMVTEQSPDVACRVAMIHVPGFAFSHVAATDATSIVLGFNQGGELLGSYPVCPLPMEHRDA
jgi:hypothetical protein